jgi:formiminotetrahydrofolate cyclodeaminase
MRDILISAALLLSAVLLLACSDPVRTASREVDRLTRLAQNSEVAHKRITKARMAHVVEQEKALRATELTAAGCNAATAPDSQPVGKCHDIVVAASSRYSGRMLAITSLASKVDASTGMVYASLLAVVDILDIIEAGLKGKLPELSTLVGRASATFADFMRVYDEFRTAIPKL